MGGTSMIMCVRDCHEYRVLVLVLVPCCFCVVPVLFVFPMLLLPRVRWCLV